MRKIIRKMHRGDTLIEVALALAIFSIISLLTLSLMNQDIAIIQGTLELEMARNEIDAQAEALRFIHNSYLSERELSSSNRAYEKLWLQLSRGAVDAGGAAGTGLANNPATISAYPAASCNVYYDNSTNDTGDPNDVHSISADHAFILNTRKLDPLTETGSDNSANVIMRVTDHPLRFNATSLYPRVIYNTTGAVGANPDELHTNDSEELSENNVYDRLAYAEGIWVIAARDATGVNTLTESTDLSSITPQFYDFHIRTCWYSPARNIPTTISTIIRLYNPEYVEKTR